MNNEQNLTGQREAQFHLTPEVDIYETDSELVLLANLPGVTETGLELEVDRGILTIEGLIDAAENTQKRSYYRKFQLSERIDVDAGNGSLKDGVLTLRLPKTATAKPQQITVKTLH